MCFRVISEACLSPARAASTRRKASEFVNHMYLIYTVHEQCIYNCGVLINMSVLYAGNGRNVVLVEGVRTPFLMSGTE